MLKRILGGVGVLWGGFTRNGTQVQSGTYEQGQLLAIGPDFRRRSVGGRPLLLVKGLMVWWPILRVVSERRRDDSSREPR